MGERRQTAALGILKNLMSLTSSVAFRAVHTILRARPILQNAEPRRAFWCELARGCLCASSLHFVKLVFCVASVKDLLLPCFNRVQRFLIARPHAYMHNTIQRLRSAHLN